MSDPDTALAITAPAPIRSWSDGYRALRRRVGEVRGWIELDGNAPDRRWPRSTGLDVLRIAAFVDAAVDRHLHVGAARRWLACKADLERDALDALADTYINNRSFWTCLAALCASLEADERAVPPHSRWSALMAQLATVRNAAYFYTLLKHEPPLLFVAMSSFDLYWAQLKHFAAVRGSDERAPDPGMVRIRMEIPRTTNADVIQLVSFWTKMLDNPKVASESGHAGIVAQWATEREKVQRLARTKDAKTLYHENHTLWRAMGVVSQHAAAAFPDLPGVNRWRQSDLADKVSDGVQTVVGTAGEVLGGVGRGIQAVTVGVARGANKGLRELFGGFTTPLLILGGGAVLAYVLVQRERPQRDS